MLAGAVPRKYGKAPGRAKRERNGGPLLGRTTNGLHVIQSPARLVRRYALTDALVVYSDAAGLPKGFIAMRVYCAG